MKSRLITSTDKEARLLVYDLCLVLRKSMPLVTEHLQAQSFNSISRIMSQN